MSDVGWDIGGYGPVGYRITPWSTLFPALGRIPKSQTLGSIYIAKLYTYYLTRLHFGQYLSFLVDVARDYGGGDSVADDLGFYTHQCDTLYQTIGDTITSGTVTGENYDSVVKAFEGNLRPADGFDSKVVYDTFFANYSLFMQCAYGLILVEAGPEPDMANEQYIVAWVAHEGVGHHPTYKAMPAPPFKVVDLLADSIRGYPFIYSDGQVGTCVYPQEGEDSQGWVPGPGGPYSPWGNYPNLTTCGIQERNGARFLVMFSDDDVTVGGYMVGLDTVPDYYDGTIRGLPMLYKLPFDFLAALADPGS